MNDAPRKSPGASRRSRALAAAPWILTALLAHAAILLHMALRTPPTPAPAPPLSLEVVTGENPYAGDIESPPGAAPEPPALPSEAEPLAALDALAALQPPGPTIEQLIGEIPVRAAPDQQPAPPSAAPPAAPTSALGELSPSAFAARTGSARQDALGRRGGGSDTESAVEAALDWLRRHQSPDGRWDRANFTAFDPPNEIQSGRPTSRLDRDADVGVTALALLCFLADGSTHRDGRDQEVVSAGLNWLLRQQQADGAFGPADRLRGYNHPLATLAVAEAAAAGEDDSLSPRIRAAVAFIEAAQTAGGGWDYAMGQDDRRNDTSIAGWCILALNAAARAGTLPSPATLYNALRHLRNATRFDGHVWYADGGTGFDIDDLGRPRYRFGPSMVAVGCVSYDLLGYRGDSATVRTMRRLMLTEPPSVTTRRDDPTGLHYDYYWYHGSLAMLLTDDGGDVHAAQWRAWNRPLAATLLTTQNTGREPDGSPDPAHGSWEPYGQGWGKWGKAGGKVYSTAIGCLTLQCYYRYLPTTLTAPALDVTPALQAAYEAGDPAQRRAVMEVTEQLRNELAEPLLLTMLADEEPTLRLRAALALARLGSAGGAGELRAQRETVGPDVRAAIDAALDRLSAGRGANLGPVLRVRPESRLALFSFGSSRPWIGQRCRLVRDGRILGDLTVLRVFDHAAAAAGQFDDAIDPADVEGATVIDAP